MIPGKKTRYINVSLILCAILLMFGCEDLTEINKNPDALSDDQVNPAFVLTGVISSSASRIAYLSFSGNITQRVVPEAMQYTQRDFLEYSITNQFAWLKSSFDYAGLNQPLANAGYLEQRARGNQDSLFLKGTAKVMQSLWFGLQTSVWGDIPYSEALKGTENLQPVFDKQIDVFAGVIKSLDEANMALSQAGPVKSSAISKADLLYAGDITKWRQFANSLRLRYLLRLSAKTTEMKAVGVDVTAEFQKMVADPAKYPLMTKAADDAALRFPGTNTTDSYTLGPLITTTTSSFYRIKAASTMVEFLKQRKDPRLTIWFRPVDVQTLVRDKGADVVIAKDAAGAVKRYVKTYQAGLDTALYVGLKIAMTNPDNHNNNLAAHRIEAVALNSAIYNRGATNPFVSYLGDVYRANTNPVVKGIFITASEVNFILAEAASRGWITGSPLTYMQAGISASLDHFGIANGDVKVYNPASHATVAFDKMAFLNNIKAEYDAAADKLEVVMQHKWVSSFSTMEGWFDHRRTGYPKIGQNIIDGGKGTQIPIRYIYGDSETNYNPENTKAAIDRLVPAINDQWSKMWLLQ